ncbi:hypothetical protein GCM10027589_18510 [Actinocorallia lasiicapitis]
MRRFMMVSSCVVWPVWEGWDRLLVAVRRDLGASLAEEFGVVAFLLIGVGAFALRWDGFAVGWPRGGGRGRG